MLATSECVKFVSLRVRKPSWLNIVAMALSVWWILHKSIGVRVGKEEEQVGSDMYEGTGNAYPEFMKK